MSEKEAKFRESGGGILAFVRDSQGLVPSITVLVSDLATASSFAEIEKKLETDELAQELKLSVTGGISKVGTDLRESGYIEVGIVTSDDTVGVSANIIVPYTYLIAWLERCLADRPKAISVEFCVHPALADQVTCQSVSANFDLADYLDHLDTLVTELRARLSDDTALTVFDESCYGDDEVFVIKKARIGRG